jgi:hypothetical protein
MRAWFGRYRYVPKTSLDREPQTYDSKTHRQRESLTTAALYMFESSMGVKYEKL